MCPKGPESSQTKGEEGFGKDLTVGGGVLAWSHPGRKGEPGPLWLKSSCWGHSEAFAGGKNIF